MKSFFSSLVLLPLSLIVVLLAVANREPVPLSLDPFAQGASTFSVNVPLFLVIFGAVMLGVLIGGTASWLVQGKHRSAERRYKREAQRLRSEVERAKAERAAAKAAAAAPGSGNLPAVLPASAAY